MKRTSRVKGRNGRADEEEEKVDWESLNLSRY